jgi:UDP-N-acetyl-2-amino-2-deoxyglucuronate dehydrogenase
LDRIYRFGIAGCGAIGPTHAGAIRQLGHVVHAVADPIAERRDKLAASARATHAHADLAALVVDPQIDIVCLCTPSGMHADHAVMALENGKHVVVEKPMDISLAACDRMIAAQKASGKLLTVISQHRFDEATQTAKQLIDSGRLGRLLLATADVKWWRTQDYYDSGDWRGTWALDGGGALMNQGVHTVDVLQWLAGGVKHVRALTRTAGHERIEVEDVAALLLEFHNGAVGTLTATTAAYDGFPVRIELFGTRGSVLIEGDAVRRIVLDDGTRLDAESAGGHALRVARGGTASVKDDAIEASQAAPFGTQWGDAHRAQIQNLIDAIEGRVALVIDGAQGREPVRVILDAYASSRGT